MTKQELFEKYDINESHNVCISVKWVTDFLDKCEDMKFMKQLMQREQKDWGSLFLTAKRMVYKFADKIIKEL